mgnify:CR=1 FL=1
MVYFRYSRHQWHVQFGVILAIGLCGCSPLSRQSAGPESSAVSIELNEADTQSEKVTLSLKFERGTKTRYQVTTEVFTAIEAPETEVENYASSTPFLKVSEFSEVAFTQEILGQLPEDMNMVVALITIDRIRYMRTSPGQPNLVFDSRKPEDQNSPFVSLIGQSYTIEINPLGYVTGVFNLRPARLAVRGPTPAHAAALDLLSPSDIFLRHGYFSLPGPDVGALAVGGRWRGLQQFNLQVPGTDMDLGTHRFEKIYRLEALEKQSVGTVAGVVFEGSPILRRTQDTRQADIPLLSCSYVGGGKFNLDAGRVEGYLEHLELSTPLPITGSPSAEDPEGRSVIVTRDCWVLRLDLD